MPVEHTNVIFRHLDVPVLVSFTSSAGLVRLGELGTRGRHVLYVSISASLLARDTEHRPRTNVSPIVALTSICR